MAKKADYYFFLCVALLLAGKVKAEVPHPAAFILTSQDNGVEPETSFTCSGTIHGYLTLPKPAIGKHLLEAIWRGPKGSVVQHSRDDINFNPPGRRTAEVWLKFTPEGKIWIPLAVQGPADADRLAYEGPWKIDVLWDSKIFARSDFHIHCL